MGVPAHAVFILVLLAVASTCARSALGAEDPLKASISGYLFCDRCDNRLNDTGDYPLAGVTVTAGCSWYGGDDGSEVTHTTRTDADGYYEFKRMLDTCESFERDIGSEYGDYFGCAVYAPTDLPPPCTSYTLSSRLTKLCNSNRLGSTDYGNFFPHAGDNFTTGRSCFTEQPSASSCRQLYRPQLKECAQRFVYDVFLETETGSTSDICSIPAGQAIFSSTGPKPAVLYTLTIEHFTTSLPSLSGLAVSGDSVRWAELVSVNYDGRRSFTAIYRLLSAPADTLPTIPPSQVRTLVDNLSFPFDYAVTIDSFAVDYIADQAFVFVSNRNCIDFFCGEDHEGSFIYVTAQSFNGTKQAVYTAEEGPPMYAYTRVIINNLKIDTPAKPTPVLYWVETRRLEQTDSNGFLQDYLQAVIKRGALTSDRVGPLSDVQVLFNRTTPYGVESEYYGFPVTQLQLDSVNHRLYALHTHDTRGNPYQQKYPTSYLSVYDISLSQSRKQAFSRTFIRPLGFKAQHFQIDVYSDPPVMYALGGSFEDFSVLHKVQLKNLDRDFNKGTVAVPPYLVASSVYNFTNTFNRFDIVYDPACRQT